MGILPGNTTSGATPPLPRTDFPRRMATGITRRQRRAVRRMLLLDIAHSENLMSVIEAEMLPSLHSLGTDLAA